MVESLLNVAHNYRSDLKNEIRFKLSIEQKIQNKNIEVAKLAQALERRISHETRSLSKQLDLANIDQCIGDMGDLAGDLGVQVHSLGERLRKLDRRINGENYLGGESSTRRREYPLLHKFQSVARTGSEGPSKSSGPSPKDTPNDPSPSQTNGPSPNGHKFNESNDKSVTINEDINLDEVDEVEEVIEVEEVDEAEVDEAEAREVDEAREVIDAMVEVKGKKSHGENVQNGHSGIHENGNGIHTNSEQGLVDTDDLDNLDFESFMSQTLSTYRQQQSERYKSMDVFLPEAASIQSDLYNITYDNSLSSSFHKSENPVSLLYVDSLANHPKSLANYTKSPAIVTQSLQTSHFKKLRISGAPITSSVKQSECECHKNGHPFELQGMKVLRDIVKTTSGEDDISETLISSQSSDSDSSGSNQGLAGTTDGYYTSLNESYKKKQRLKRGKQKPQPYTRDYSPTPKHEPSHRILKPKGSILKLATPRSPTFPKSPTSKSKCPGSSKRKLGPLTQRVSSMSLDPATAGGEFVPPPTSFSQVHPNSP